RLKERAFLRVAQDRRLLHCMEVRHASFLNPEFFELLREFNVAFVFADSAGKWPYTEDLTSDFIYARLHGAEELYVSGYTDKALDRWADRIEHWRKGKQPSDAKLIACAKRPAKRLDVFVYFDNDAKVYAPFDAQRLAAQLGVE